MKCEEGLRETPERKPPCYGTIPVGPRAPSGGVRVKGFGPENESAIRPIMENSVKKGLLQSEG